ncbi:MAG: ATP-dependent RNA helicase HrpA [Porticoccaceae bacterium]
MQPADPAREVSAKDLRALIEQCMNRDRPRLQRQLAALRPTAGTGRRQPQSGCSERSDKAAQARLDPSEHIKPTDLARERIVAAIRASIAKAEERRQRRPAIVYPDNLPIAARREDIAAAIRDHQVVVIAGETGSGKTTQIPKICLDLGRGVTGLIGHTQPRRLAARMVAARIAEELRVPLGGVVGYQVRFQDQSGDDTLVKLMTDGILLAEIPRDRLLSRYDTLIIDEAHERSLNIDFLLGYVKTILPRRPDLKLIITSATIDVERFSRHFDNAPVLEVSGRSYPVKVRYRPPLDEERDLYQAVVAAVDELLALPERGDILVFLSGEREIREAAAALRQTDFGKGTLGDGKFRHLEVLPLYARLSAAEQNRAFQPHLGTRVVLATNVAETSLTVPGVRYVIDTGYARISRYSYRTKVQRLPVEPISQASANQRAGRCGRVADGVCIRLYGEEDFTRRPAFTDPEIVRTNLAAVILQMLHLRIGDVRSFPFVDPPDRRFVNDGFSLLHELSAVDASGALTPVGHQLCALPVDPRLGRMLLSAAVEGSLREVLIIVSALSIQDPRERPADKRQAADERHRAWQDKESDFIGLLNLWNHFEAQRQALSRNQFASYCRQQFVSVMRMREWRDLHHQVHLACRELGLRDNQQPAAAAAIHRALLAGLLSQIGFRHDEREFLGTRNRKFYLFPGSGLAKKPPKWLMTAELLETSRLYAHHNAAIAADWLPQLAAHLVKKSHSEPHYDPRTGQVMAWEKQTLYGLVIVERQRVPFAAIDPQNSREVFIQAALVEGRYGVKDRGRGEFAKYNRRLLDELHELEERLRRRDILADERVLYQFYDERIPADVVSLATFERWREGAEREQPQLLIIDRHLLVCNEPGAEEAAQFPGELDWQGHRYRLHYRFEPGHPDDGVSLDVPVGILHQVPQHRAEWLVPGLLRDKLIALVKGLPKEWRKHFVPVPDYVDRVLAQMVPTDCALTAALAEGLQRLSGICVPADCWQLEKLDAFYRINYRLLDDHGKLIDSDRDLATLRAKYRQQVQASIQSAGGETMERSGLRRWDFGELPELVVIRRGGHDIRGYPALVDEGDSVAIRLRASPALALNQSRQGLIRLAMLEHGQPAIFLRRQLLRGKDLLLTAAQLPGRSVLVEDLIAAAYRQALFSDRPLPREQSAFQQCLEMGRGQIVTVAHEIEALLLSWVHELTPLRELLWQRQSAFLAAVTDCRAQLDTLLGEGVLSHTRLFWLRQYLRYIRAAKTRFEKLPAQVAKDQRYSAELAEYSRQLRQFATGTDDYPPELLDDLEKYRFMIEEYRVSLFSQQLKTVIPVSASRLSAQADLIKSTLSRLLAGNPLC